MLAAAENALLKALREHRDLVRVVRTVDSLPQVGMKDLTARYYADAPALYVAPGVFQVREDMMHPTFAVAAIVRNVGGQAKARKGDGLVIGTDHLVLLAARALHNQVLAGQTWRMTRGEAVDEEAFYSAGISAVEMTFEGSGVALVADYDEEHMSELFDFLRMRADTDIGGQAGADEHEKWLREPPDYTTSRPHATDEVQLQGATP